MNRHFSREDIGMIIQHKKRCSISLVIREMQTKTTMRYHLTATGMAIFKKMDSADEDVEKSEPLHTVAGNLKWYSPCGKEFGTSSKC